MTRPELAVGGVPETALPASLIEQLPQNQASAPWTCSAQSVVWFTRGGSAAKAALPLGIRDRVASLAVIGGVVRYLDTPVGPYDEVLGIVGHRDGLKVAGSVVFMAVDSPVSLVGGRTNWGMPKTLASFDGEVGDRSSMTATGTVGQPWRVTVTPRVLGPAVPFAAPMRAVQQFGDGTVRASVLRTSGRMRPALITVRVESDSFLPAWLRSGRHLGGVVESMTFSLGVPKAAVG